MNLTIITMDDNFYIPEFFKDFLSKIESLDITIDCIVIQPPFNERKIELIKRGYRFYGIINFIRRSISTLILGLLDRLHLLKNSIRGLSRRYGIKSEVFEDVNSPLFLDYVKEIKPDVILSVAAPQIFKKDLLDIPKWGCINVHAAKLPNYRGMMPNFWAMYHGAKTAGITVHTMDEKIDKGKIILQGEVPINPEYSLDDLLKKSKKIAAGIVIEALKQIKNGSVNLKNYRGKGSYFSFPTKAEVREFRRRGNRLL